MKQLVKTAHYYCIVVGLCCLLGAGGCGSLDWTAPVERHPEISWPPPPNPVKARYIGELREFKQTGHSLFSILTGKSEAGKISKPTAIAVGSDGRIAVADAGRKGVHFYRPATKQYRLLFMAGKAVIQSPVNVAFDARLNLYVSDSILRRVLIFDSEGELVREIGAAGATPLGRPTGLAYQSKGDRLYVADTTLHTIHLFTGQGVYQTSFGGRGVGAGALNFPTHICIDSQGTLLVNDAMNFRIQMFDRGNKFVAKFGKHGNGSGDFAMPKGVGVDRWGVIYVVDSLFDRVQLFDRQGNFLLTIGSRGTNAAEFWLPSGLFIDQDDRLYVCDTYNRRIQIFQLHDNIPVKGGRQ